MTAARNIANLISGTSFTSKGSLDIPLTIQGATGQTADLLQIKNNAGTVTSKIDASGEFVNPGALLQFTNIRVDTLATYTGGASGNGTEITLLNQTITPKRTESKLLIYWEVQGEAHWDGTFVIWKNGTLMSNGYNTSVGNQRWSGYSTFPYDPDFSTTPQRMILTFIDTPNTISPVTYSIAYRSSNGNTQTFQLNRPIASAGTDGHEVAVSMGYIMEIAQ
jgi:hypothetical protein